MRFGACIDCNIERAKILKKVGYDYAELNVSKYAQMSDDDFEKFLADIKEVGIPCEAACIFLPSSLNVSDPHADKEEIKRYLEIAMERSHKLGVQTIVFGSGKARNIPEDVDIHDGFNALLKFASDLAAPEAEKYGIRIAVEPLYSAACNVIHTVKEAVAFSKLSKKDNVKALADIVHMTKENEDISILDDCGGWIIHSHTSKPMDGYGLFPTHEDGYDQYPFVKAIYKTGCTRMSIEAKIEDETFETDAAEGLYTLIDAYDRVLNEN